MSVSSDLPDGLPALLTIHDIAALFRVQRTTAYARTRDPDFPDPLVISGSCYRWYADEVLAYIAARRAPKKQHLRRVAPPEPGASIAASAPPRLPRARMSRRPRSTSRTTPDDT